MIWIAVFIFSYHSSFLALVIFLWGKPNISLWRKKAVRKREKTHQKYTAIPLMIVFMSVTYSADRRWGCCETLLWFRYDYIQIITLCVPAILSCEVVKMFGRNDEYYNKIRTKIKPCFILCIQCNNWFIVLSHLFSVILWHHLPLLSYIVLNLFI